MQSPEICTAVQKGSLFDFDFSTQDDLVCGVPTVERQTGWHRPYRFTICQEIEVLLAIREFSYDLNDTAFLRYFESRTGRQIRQSLAEYPEGRSARDWRVPLSEVKRPHYLINNAPLPDDEFESMKGVYAIERAKLQDCWEIYNLEEVTQ
ncbi:MAG: hypothetical protein ACFUZC_16460 [Chthoniobacteraceae bacterium]